MAGEVEEKLEASIELDGESADVEAQLQLAEDIEAIRADTVGATILIVPGLGNSGPEHWQTKWLHRLPNAVRVEQKDWDHPNKDQWVSRLDEYLERYRRCYLVEHSLAAATGVHWTREYSGKTRAKIRGALIVGPADVDIPVQEISGFAPMPLEPLPYKTMVVASEDDPIVRIDRAKMFAHAWGAQFRNVGKLGHINADSNLGRWPEGIRLLRELIKMS